MRDTVRLGRATHSYCPPKNLCAVHIIHRQNSTPLVLIHDKREPLRFVRFFIARHIHVDDFAEPFHQCRLGISIWEPGRLQKQYETHCDMTVITSPSVIS